MKDLIETVIDCERVLVDLTDTHRIAILAGRIDHLHLSNSIFKLGHVFRTTFPIKNNVKLAVR